MPEIGPGVVRARLTGARLINRQGIVLVASIPDVDPESFLLFFEKCSCAGQARRRHTVKEVYPPFHQQNFSIPFNQDSCRDFEIGKI